MPSAWTTMILVQSSAACGDVPTTPWSSAMSIQKQFGVCFVRHPHCSLRWDLKSDRPLQTASSFEALDRSAAMTGCIGGSLNTIVERIIQSEVLIVKNNFFWILSHSSGILPFSRQSLFGKIFILV